MLNRLLPICVVFVVGCGGMGGGGSDDDATLRIGLAAQRLDWSDGVATSAAITVTLVGADGSETDVTGAASFEIVPAGRDSASSAGDLVLNVTAKTYRYLDDEEQAPAKDGANKGGGA